MVALDLRLHEALAEHSDGRAERVPLTPNRSVAEVTVEMLTALRRLGGPVEINPEPQETTWTTPLDEDEAHATYDPDQVTAYFAAATRAALVLTALRAPYRGRSTPVNAWWGSFDLAVSLFSGRPVEPPEADFISRNAGDAEQIEVGWWPGDARYPNAAFFAYAYPAPEGFAAATLAPPAARWDATLGEYILDWDDIRARPDPHEYALEFARSAVRTPVRCAAGIPTCRSASRESRRRSPDSSAAGARQAHDRAAIGQTDARHRPRLRASRT